MAPPNLSATATAAAENSRAHKRVRWRVPAGGKRRPGVLDATRAELVRSLEQRHGALWLRISRAAIVAGYPIERALSRVRSLRSDGAASLLAMTVALLYLADVRSGFIGKPRQGGGHWHRYGVSDLAQLAYGAQGEAELRRARRALDVLVSLRWIAPTKQVRRFQEDGSYRSEPGVRHLNLSRVCEMTGTTWLLQRDRQHADRTKGAGTVAFEEARTRRQKRHTGRPPQGAPSEQAPRPDATGDPPKRLHMRPALSPAGMQALSELTDLFKIG
jgi:hypothetical protein